MIYYLANSQSQNVTSVRAFYILNFDPFVAKLLAMVGNGMY